MNLFWRRRSLTLSEVRDCLTLPIEEAKKRAKILVIDDAPDAFPVELIRAEGYNVQQWKQVQNLRNLEEGQFDIIILDIYNICPKEFSLTDGLGVLEHLKRINPAQIVIAYSGKKFDLNNELFWRIADDYLGKPTDVLKVKDKVDGLLRERFTAEYYWKTLSEFLKARGINDRNIGKLESEIAMAVSNRKSIGEADVAKLLNVGKDIISTTWTIVQIITRFSK